MSGDHSHSHSHAHSHAPSAKALAGDPRARRALWWALTIGMIVMVAEAIAGVVFGSLALLSDAAHMLTDVGAYGIALWAAHTARRPVTTTHTFGVGRVEIVAALINGATLLAVSAWVIVESVRRLLDPPEINASGMMLFALIGLIANALVLTILWRAGSSSLNMRGAVLHAAGDLLGSLAALIAGVVIAVTGWVAADALASLALALLIVVAAWRLVRASVDVLLDAAPRGIDADAVSLVLLGVDDVVEAHDIHSWTMSPGVTAISAHVRIHAGSDASQTLDEMHRALSARLGVTHSTLQLREDRSGLPLTATPLMSPSDAIEWATDHIASLHTDLPRSVIFAAAGAASVGLTSGDRVSPVALTARTLRSLGRAPQQSTGHETMET